MSKPFALLVIPAASAFAFTVLWARRGELEHLPPFTAIIEILLIAMLLAAQTAIVLYAL